MYLDTRLFSFFSPGNQELRYDLITVRTRDIAVIKMLAVMDRVLHGGLHAQDPRHDCPSPAGLPATLSLA